MAAAPAVVLGSEMHMMDSQHTGRTYQITISLPLGYSKLPGEGWPFDDTPPQWPVVYVLDGNWYAGMVTGMIRPVAWCGSTTDAIVVGIGYAEDADPIEAFRESFTRRNFDLTPVQNLDEDKAMEERHHRPAPTGGAGRFLKFLQEELIPFIEKSYRADPSKRILAGHSYGGLFAVFCLFEVPDLFDTLIIGSPTLAYGSRFAFQQEEAFFKEGKILAATVYLYAGDEEYLNDTALTDMLRLAAILESRNYEGFSLYKNVFLDQNHCQVMVPGFHWGLKSALKK